MKNKVMKKMYIVKFSSGSYDDYSIFCVFVTEKKSIATKYVTKFNKILKKWKNYYSQFENDDRDWIKEEYVNQHFKRWHALREINECYWEEIEVR
jgi:hypothetical protein